MAWPKAAARRITAGLFKVLDLVILTFVARLPPGSNPRLLPATTPLLFSRFPLVMQPS
jgi:hypothetical protein